MNTLATVRAVDAVLQQDRRSTIRQITAEVNISRASAHKIIRKELDMTKRALKFVPHILTEDQKRQRVELCRQNLKECQDPLFLWSVITGDES